MLRLGARWCEGAETRRRRDGAQVRGWAVSWTAMPRLRVGGAQLLLLLMATPHHRADALPLMATPHLRADAPLLTATPHHPADAPALTTTPRHPADAPALTTTPRHPADALVWMAATTASAPPP